MLVTGVVINSFSLYVIVLKRQKIILKMICCSVSPLSSFSVN